jgi:DNA-binding MarR family transcriptional regulator
MNYTLRQLQIFFKICQNESITLTAEELHLSQPAVSIQLKNFQQQFEFPLTETIGRKIYITDFGREIAEAAENIINQDNCHLYTVENGDSIIKILRKNAIYPIFGTNGSLNQFYSLNKKINSQRKNLIKN